MGKYGMRLGEKNVNKSSKSKMFMPALCQLCKVRSSRGGGSDGFAVTGQIQRRVAAKSSF